MKIPPRFKIPLLFALLPALPAFSAHAAEPAAAPRTVVYVVDDRTLAGIAGKFYGADMLVGVRIQLLSQWQGADGAQMQAAGTLLVQREADGGYRVRIDSRSAAAAGDGSVAPGDLAQAQGGDGVQIAGIGQITQIAGDDNRLRNLAAIRLLPAAAAEGEYNGLARSASGAGGYVAQVEFADGGVTMGLLGPGSQLQQTVGDHGAMQVARIAGSGQSGSNSLQLQLLSAAMPAQWQQQLGIYQALAGMRQISR